MTSDTTVSSAWAITPTRRRAPGPGPVRCALVAGRGDSPGGNGRPPAGGGAAPGGGGGGAFQPSPARPTPVPGVPAPTARPEPLPLRRGAPRSTLHLPAVTRGPTPSGC